MRQVAALAGAPWGLLFLLEPHMINARELLEHTERIVAHLRHFYQEETIFSVALAQPEAIRERPRAVPRRHSGVLLMLESSGKQLSSTTVSPGALE